MEESLIISHLKQAQNLLNAADNDRIRYVISFGDPGTDLPENIFAHNRLVLRLECHDLSPRAVFSEALAYPSRCDTNKIIYFSHLIKNLIRSDEKILMHCYGGIARSPAAAAIFLQLFGHKNSTEVYDTIMQLRPGAEPNYYLLQHADQILGSNLLEVFQAHQKVTC